MKRTFCTKAKGLPAPSAHKALGPSGFGSSLKGTLQKASLKDLAYACLPVARRKGRGDFHHPISKENQDLKTIPERLEHCNWQIAQAIEESGRQHTETEHLGILLWEMDWRVERDCLLAELAAQKEAA